MSKRFPNAFILPSRIKLAFPLKETLVSSGRAICERFVGAREGSRTILGSSFVMLLAMLIMGQSALTGQEDEPPRDISKPGVRIVFLPPPMEGLLSLGVYNKTGKLVRTLRTEANAEKDFTVGLNGLIIQWDGRDDSGNLAPAGKYLARGLCVGALEIEGVAYHCNDWVAGDDSPRVREITSIQFESPDHVIASARIADGSERQFRVTADGKVTPFKDPRTAPEKNAVEPRFKDVSNAVDIAPGKDGTEWVIDQRSEGVEVKQFSQDGECLRRLAIQPGEPSPRKIVASRSEDFIALLESNTAMQRVRALALEAPSQAVPATGPAGAAGTAGADQGAANLSTWRTLYEKVIVNSDSFQAVADKLGREKPVVPEPRVKVRLLPNSLYKEAVHEVELSVAIDPNGARFVTADSLPIYRLTETPGLKWAVMSREAGSKAVTLFQSDGMVVEEFRARKLANMMAFDAGEYEWAGK